MSQIDILKNAFREVIHEEVRDIIQEELKMFKSVMITEMVKISKSQQQRTMNESKPFVQRNVNPYDDTPSIPSYIPNVNSLLGDFMNANEGEMRNLSNY